MEAIIRVDGNLPLGLGHVMRCLSIADALKDYGWDVLFVLGCDSRYELIESRGFRYSLLQTGYRNLDDEIPELANLIHEYETSILLVDSYYASQQYFTRLSRVVDVAYLDDWMDVCYQVSFLINYNAYADLARYKKLYDEQKLSHPKFALGIKYAPLRTEFQHVDKKKISSETKKCLVLVGGSDPERMAMRIARILIDNKAEFLNCAFHFVLGNMEPDLDCLRSLSENEEYIFIHQDVINMAELMKGMDIAISASGTTLYELCACGIPSLIYCLADNQKRACEYFAKENVMISVGDARATEDFDSTLVDRLAELVSDRVLREALSSRAQLLVDGKGSQRLSKWLTNECLGKCLEKK